MIAIIGTGYVGTHFANILLKNNLSFITTTREKSRNAHFPWVKHSIGENLPQEIQRADSIYIFVPPSENLLNGLKNIHQKLRSDQKIIYTSSIGIYPKDSNQISESDLDKSCLSERQLLLQQLEEEVLKRPNSLVLRLGGLIGHERHPAKSLSGKKEIPEGLTPINMTHIDDLATFLLGLQKNYYPGVYNFISQGHPLKQDFYPSECQRLGIETCTFKPEGNPQRIILSSKLEEMYHFTFPQRFIL